MSQFVTVAILCRSAPRCPDVMMALAISVGCSTGYLDSHAIGQSYPENYEETL